MKNRQPPIGGTDPREFRCYLFGLRYHVVPDHVARALAIDEPIRCVQRLGLVHRCHGAGHVTHVLEKFRIKKMAFYLRGIERS